MEETKVLAKVKEVLEWSYCFIIAVVLALLVRYYLGTPTLVKQPSMYPTLEQDQRLFLSRWDRTKNRLPERGDIITFEAPTQDFVPAFVADLNNPVAKYEYNPTGWFTKFRYYVLELSKKSYIKRVIGLPGEHVKIEDNKVYINGKLLNETYLVEGMITDDLNATAAFMDVVVPEGCVYVMGDNRGQSTDSRRFGCIPQEKIESTVWIRFWPFSAFGKVK